MDNEPETTNSRGKQVEIFKCCEWMLVFFFSSNVFNDIQLLLIKFKI